MRYRKLSSDGDYVFGQGGADYYANSPQTVAQAIDTRLLLWQGEWFVDTTDGTPYQTQILGAHTQSTYDAAIKARVLGTPGVQSIMDYSSALDTATRKLAYSMTVDTIYSIQPIIVQGSL